MRSELEAAPKLLVMDTCSSVAGFILRVYDEGRCFSWESAAGGHVGAAHVHDQGGCFSWDRAAGVHVGAALGLSRAQLCKCICPSDD